MALKGLVAYPSKPTQIGSTVQIAIRALRDHGGGHSLEPWEEVDVCGRFIASAILGRIADGDLLVADTTRPNFNVVFEVGFAIGKGKQIVLIKHSAIESPNDLVREVGIFDTLGYSEYANGQELTDLLIKLDDHPPISLVQDISEKSPVYFIMPKMKTDSEIRIQSRIEKARLPYRTYDPEEHGRLPAGEAIEHVARSHAVIVPLLPVTRVGATVHNLRAAFVAGLTMGMDRILLLLQEGDDPVPLDYRDLVKRFRYPQQIDDYVADLAGHVTERLIGRSATTVSAPVTFLEHLDLGASSAENELSDLARYYLETDEFQRAQRGEINVVAGRKGSGKTAMFVRLRDRLRRDPNRLVLDLKPEGFQLLKFKERVLDFLEEGTREHTITAFWEYLLLLEACSELLDLDKERHLRDETLFHLYGRLSDLYVAEGAQGEVGFAERMMGLTERIAAKLAVKGVTTGTSLSTGEITELIYTHDVPELRDVLHEYLAKKRGFWIVFDNLDKGWPAHGVTSLDILTLRCLLDAVTKIERVLHRDRLECHGIVFIRNDVYELLQDATPDRGKIAQVILDWSDPALLREMLRRRLLHNLGEDYRFEEIWPRVCVSHVDGEESAQYIIDRSLMRPRGLLEFVQHCHSHAVNLGHEKIQVEDIAHGEEVYSSELLVNIGFEIRDVMPQASDILYEFVEEEKSLSNDRVRSLLVPKMGDETDELLELLLWYGFLGLARGGQEATYIYDVKYDFKRLLAMVAKQGPAVRYLINPAFWRALEVHD